jgi:4-amino-4-deoxy-L-arabinose transferase-like glycosyltransferase
VPTVAVREIGAVVAIQVALLTALSARYGLHRDELYFLAAGKRLDWGYVDQPPLTPLIARLFGDSPVTLRIAATLAGAAIVITVALIAREFGGGRGAQLLAAAAAALSGLVLGVTHMLATATLDMLLWTVLAFFVVRLLRTGDGRWWLAIGVTAGVAMTNKWLVPLLVVAWVGSLVAVGPRTILRSWWLVGGAALGVSICAPIVIWQAAHDFPLLTVARGIGESDGAENRLMFVPFQILYLSPVLVPVWIAGFAVLWRNPRYRSIALAYVVLCALVLALGGKPYYPMPLLLVLLAAGAEPAWRWATRHRSLAMSGAAVGAALSVLIALPVLPARALGPVLAVNPEQGEQVGWRDFTASVSAGWQQAGPDAVIFTRNYGQAAAVERYGPDFVLPQPFSGHMSYWDWGPPPDSQAGPVVVVGNRHPAFTGCHVVAVHRAVVENEEDGTEIAVCDPVVWSDVWPSVRRFYG